MVNNLIKSVRVVSVPHPFRVERLDMVTPEGLTLVQILELVQPDRILRSHAHIFVGDELIERKWWGFIIPNENEIVTIRVVPMGGGGGGGKSPLKTILTIGIIAATFAFAAPLGVALLGPGLAGTAIGVTTIGAMVGTAVIGGIGMLVSNALIPPKSTAPRMATLSGSGGALRDSPTLFIEGARNAARPFGVYPVVLGVHRHVPPLLSKPFTEVVGTDQHLRMVVVWGYGRLDISDLRIGTTPIENFDDIQVETVEGISGDPGLTLFPEQVSQEDFSVLLKQVDSFTTRTSSLNVDELSVDIIFPRGLVTFNNSGNRNNRTVVGEIQYRETGTAGDWLNPNLAVFDAVIDNATTAIGYEFTETTPADRGREGGTSRVVSKPNGVLHAPVTDTGSQQIITANIKTLDTPSIITATAAGAGSVVKAIQVSVEGTDTADAFQSETLPVFTENTPGVVKGSLIFKTITKVTIPAHDGGGALTVRFKTNKTNAVRFGFQWKVDSRTQYDIRVRRTTSDTTSTQIFDEMNWTALRSIINEDPDNFAFPLAKTAIKVRATNQLTNIIDTLNARVSSYVLDWNGAAWVEALSSNPAALFRHVLQSVAMATPLADARIDLTTLETWHEFCATNGFEFNMIRDFQASVWEVLSDIAIAGRATPVQVDGKWSVVIDQEQAIPVQHFTPRNSWGFEAEKMFADIPHGLRLRFANQKQDWEQDERIVYDDGFDESNATQFEQLDAIGITDEDHIWKYGRYNLAQMRLRPERWTLSVDFEYLVCKKGDLVLITHDVLLVGLQAGRIKAIQTDGGGNATGITVDEILVMEAGKSYGVSIRTIGDVELTKSIVLDVGDQTTIVFDSVIPVANIPVVGDLFGFGEVGLETIEGLILSLETQSNLTARLIIVPNQDAVYTSDTGTIPDFETKITRQATLPAPVILNVRTDESVLKLGAGNTIIPRIGISYARVSDEFAATVEAQIKLTGSDEIFRPVTISAQTADEIIIEEVEELETYDVRLHWVSPNKLPGDWSFVNNTKVIGQTDPPEPLQNLNISVFGGTVLMRWGLPSDLDVRFGGTVEWRHSHETVAASASWLASVSIGVSSKGSDLIAQLPLKPGTYLARVFDKGRRPSTVVAVSTKQASVLTFADVAEVIEQTAFSGTHSNTIAVDDILKLAGAGLFDDIPDLDLVPDLDSFVGIETSGVYEFAAGFDFGSVQKVRLTTDINALIVNTLDLIDDRTADIDTWESFDGDVSGAGDARVQERNTDDDPAGSPTWTEWNNLDSAEFQSRAHEFRLNISTTDPAFNIIISKLQVKAEDVP